VNLDSPNHQDHVSFPLGTQPDGGDCPDSHPVRLPMLFYEILFAVDLDQFPHGNGVQPFLLSCGDATGYGLHGDFLNGWDTNIMQAALEDVSCLANNTNEGNDPAACKPFTPYVKTSNPDQSCALANPINNFEDLGFFHTLQHLPGCNSVTGAGPSPPFCGDAFYFQNPKYFSPVLRVLLRAKSNGLYVTATDNMTPLKANCAEKQLAYSQAFVLLPMTGGGYAIRTETSLNYVSASSRSSGALYPNRPSPSTWETFTFNFVGSGGPTAEGTQATITSLSDNMFVSVQANGELWPNAATAGNTETFYVVDADTFSANVTGNFLGPKILYD